MNWKEFFFWFKANPWARYPIMLACIIGTGFGFYYYEWQLKESPIYYWPLIPDSPFFTLMYVIVLAAYSLGRRSNLFDTFTFIGLNKIGLWSLFVLLYDSDHFFAPQAAAFSSVLFLLHIGMILCSFTLLEDMRRPDKAYMGLLLAIFLLSDYFDYIVGTHPYLSSPRMDVIGMVALILTAVCWGSVWIIMRKSEL